MDKAGAKENSIYKLWQNANRARYVNFTLTLGIAYTLMLIPIDYFMVEKSHPLLAARFASLLVLTFSLVLAKHMQKIAKRENLKNHFYSFLLIVAPFSLHIFYNHFIFMHRHEGTQIFFVSLMLVIFYSAFVLHRFRKEQYVYNSISIGITLPHVFINPQLSHYAYITIVCHLVTAFIFAFFRTDFFRNLYAANNLLRVVVPGKIADKLSVASEYASMENAFKPRDRFCVCLCADWRDFQDLSKQKTGGEVSQLIEKFYDQVQAKLKIIVPSQNYYFNWVADEMFIVFFSDNDSREEVMHDALKFSHVLATELHGEIAVLFNGEITFDIGLSSGIGLLGLQGPRESKKTTITGEVAGLAKRFEREAGSIRQAALKIDSPVVVMDKVLHEYCIKNYGLFNHQLFQQHSATTKDIVNMQVFKWTDSWSFTLDEAA